MQASLNKCILLGTIDRRGVEVSYHGAGTPKASFALLVSEQGSDGREHQAWYPCEIWGKRAEQVGELEPGALVLVEGKLKRVKQGEAWSTVVSGFDAQALRHAPAAAPL
jgi:single-stranded DNA-binding protein